MKDHGLFQARGFSDDEHVADRTIACSFHNRLSRLEIENVVRHLKGCDWEASEGMRLVSG